MSTLASCDPRMWLLKGRAGTELGTDTALVLPVSLHWLALGPQDQPDVGTGAWVKSWTLSLSCPVVFNEPLMSFALRLLTRLCVPVVNEDSGLLNLVIDLSQQFATSEGLVSSELRKCRVVRGSLWTELCSYMGEGSSFLTSWDDQYMPWSMRDWLPSYELA